jgi:hypothetical protein
MTITERMAVIGLVWVAAWGLGALRSLVYRLRTRGWIPLSKDSAWMLDAGYSLEFPPPRWPLYLVAAGASVLVWWL